MVGHLIFMVSFVPSTIWNYLVSNVTMNFFAIVRRLFMVLVM